MMRTKKSTILAAGLAAALAPTLLAPIAAFAPVSALSAGFAAPAAASVLPAVEKTVMSGGTLGKHYVEVAPGIWVLVKGERERRQVRYARLVAFWSPDQKSVAEAEGFPLHRWRNLEGERMTETWFYLETNREYVFNADGSLLKSSFR